MSKPNDFELEAARLRVCVLFLLDELSGYARDADKMKSILTRVSKLGCRDMVYKWIKSPAPDRATEESK